MKLDRYRAKPWHRSRLEQAIDEVLVALGVFALVFGFGLMVYFVLQWFGA